MGINIIWRRNRAIPSASPRERCLRESVGCGDGSEWLVGAFSVKKKALRALVVFEKSKNREVCAWWVRKRGDIMRQIDYLLVS
jgi:hypothetical protein